MLGIGNGFSSIVSDSSLIKEAPRNEEGGRSDLGGFIQMGALVMSLEITFFREQRVLDSKPILMTEMMRIEEIEKKKWIKVGMVDMPLVELNVIKMRFRPLINNG